MSGFASQKPKVAAFSLSASRSVGMSVANIDSTAYQESAGVVAGNEADVEGNLIITSDNLDTVQVATSYNSSLLSHELKLQDLKYYSDYSYEIRSKLPISTWGDAFDKFAHPAGLQFYGKLMDSPNDSPF